MPSSNENQPDGEHTANSVTIPTKPTPLPKLQVFILVLIQFSEPVTALVIYPFIIQFVRDTGVTGGDETKTGYFAGIIESIFFLAECLTVVYFGRASDRYGRRPVLLFGPVGLALSMLGFGLSKRYWGLVFWRCWQGAFNGNIGVSKSVMAEISDSTNAAEMYSLMPFMWSIGSSLGPFIGGSLANPAIRFPDSLGKIHLLREFPYFLPCATAGALAFSAFVIGFLGLKETLPSGIARQKRIQTGTETEPLLAHSTDASSAIAAEEPVPPLRDLFVRPVLISLTNHGFLSFCQMSYDVLVPLVYATPIELGGLGLEPFVHRPYHGAIRFVHFWRIPFSTCLRGEQDESTVLVIAVMLFQMSSSFVIFPTFACTQIFIVNSAPTQNSLGGVNGLAQMVASTARSIAPSFASSLFATSVSHNLLGGNLVFFVLSGIALCGLRSSLLLPHKLRSG
ncbi:Major facilitator superfamily multidrug-resistance DHA1 sub-family [Mycena venus]|uniref:Major facilitator superfamily multidrug-resistance DHA1 sub-family n=1 Tax=Mycena venus TaxID=2733690 RepID=A0A8H7CET9_9AGAR|nr:Major facilitator superfamily multidrug-resistance DHA1 sub-family [Mycena venus]